LTLTIRQKGGSHRAQDNVIVDGGQFESTAFIHLKPGQYTLEISAPLEPYHSMDAILTDSGRIEKDRVVYLKKSIRVGGDATKKAKPLTREEALKLAAEEKERQKAAERLDRVFLDSGINVESVKATGPQKTTLRIRYVLTSRVFAHKFINNENLILRLRSAGFEKIIFDDTHGETWTSELD
jgi:hypothetical protein